MEDMRGMMILTCHIQWLPNQSQAFYMPFRTATVIATLAVKVSTAAKIVDGEITEKKNIS